ITAIMKTTLIMRDDLVRRAKARAALRGQPLSRYVEDSLERALREDESAPATVAQWIESLPRISKSAADDLKTAIASKDFRQIDEEMWQ
ncbi:DUF6364 family protein, partial [Arthrospira platensis SPKY2]